jgi:hypothetical protein
MDVSRVCVSILAGVALDEGLAAVGRHAARGRLYAAAHARARAAGRPLIVVGDPDAGAHTRAARAYGCGDLCVDARSCPTCAAARQADLVAGVDLPDGVGVVYCACVLEYVADPWAAAGELVRLAGCADDVFLVTVQPRTLTAMFYPGARWRLRPDSAARPLPYRYEAVEPVQRAVVGLGLVALGVGAARGREVGALLSGAVWWLRGGEAGDGARRGE